MKKRVLVINTGSTSTKIAVFEDTSCVFKETVNHSGNQLYCGDSPDEQSIYRAALIRDALYEHGFSEKDLTAIAARGGLLPPGPGGGRKINQAMVNRLKYRPLTQHASNLSAVIAFEIAEKNNIPAFIYDPITTDELCDVARVSGTPFMNRISTVHALNSRAVAIKISEELEKPYAESNLIVAHIGGGISFSAHKNGKMVDLVLADEGAFSVTVSGGLPTLDFLKLCFSGKYTQEELIKMLRGEGGMKAYLNTTDAKEVEKRIKEGDKEAELIYRAMAYQIAKSIAQLSIVFDGKVDGIGITGGLANSEMLTEMVKKHVQFIAPVHIMPGEYEMEALNNGILRILNGEEYAPEYAE